MWHVSMKNDKPEEAEEQKGVEIHTRTVAYYYIRCQDKSTSVENKVVSTTKPEGVGFIENVASKKKL